MLDAVDLDFVHCVVGRFWDMDRWVIVDRSGSLADSQLLTTLRENTDNTE
jgi:hypothetical protein